MWKKLSIVFTGSLVYWIFGFLLHKLFEGLNESVRFLEILFIASISPFILGLIISIIIKNKKGWIYGSISYLLYFIWLYIFSWMFELQFKDFATHLITMIKAYFYLGIVATLFAAFGGFLGDFIRRRKTS